MLTWKSCILHKRSSPVCKTERTHETTELAPLSSEIATVSAEGQKGVLQSKITGIESSND